MRTRDRELPIMQNNKLKSLIIRAIPIWHLYKLRNFGKYLSGRLKTFNLIRNSEENQKKVYIVGLPSTGNLGDQAIAVAQVEFMRYFVGLNSNQIECIYHKEFYEFLPMLHSLIKAGDIIGIQGGGNIGDQYPSAEYVRQVCAHEFPNNRIVVFPQTSMFSDTAFGRALEENSVSIYSNHRDLTICAREKYSYEQMNALFHGNKVLLVPDIVFSYRYQGDYLDREHKIIFCLRNDCERLVEKTAVDEFVQLCRIHGFDVEFTDTVIDGDDYFDLPFVKLLIDKKIQELSSAEIVVTDRLHGMILTLLSSTNCIVLNNYNHKVRGVFEWVSSYEGIKLVSTHDEFENALLELKGARYEYDFDQLREFYQPLIDEFADMQ